MTDNFGDQREQKQAIKNFEKCVKPGGMLLIDHRNYDNIMETGSTPSKCIYYNVSRYWVENHAASLMLADLALNLSWGLVDYLLISQHDEKVDLKY